MSIQFGTVIPGSTLYIPFDTFAGATGASITISGLAVTDIFVFRNGSPTQRASTNGYALLDTDGIDIDGITGIQGFSINLADNSDAGFYVAGASYFVVVSSITIDSQTVNFVAATFNIGYPDAILNTTIATLTTQTLFTLTAGPAEDSLVGCAIIVHDIASAVQMGMSLLTAYVGVTRTVTLSAAMPFTIAVGDNVSILRPVLLPATMGRSIALTAAGQAGVDWGNVGNPTSTVGLTNTTVDLVANAVDSAAIATGAITNAKFAAGAIDDAAFNVTEVLNANITSISGDTVAADNAEAFFDGTGYAGTNNIIPTVTNLTNLPTIPTNWITAAGVAAGALNGKGDWALASVLGALADAAADGDPTTSDTIMMYVKQLVNVLTGSAGIVTFPAADIPGNGVSLAEVIRQIYDEVAGLNGGILLDAAGVRSAIGLASANLDTQLDALPTAAENADAVWDEDATAHQTQGTFGQAIGDPAADSDSIWGLVNTNLNATVGSRASQASVDVIDDLLDTEIAAILADTNELQMDWANGGRLDNILDSRASQASVDTIDDFLDTEIAAIISTLGTPAGASISADIAAIEAQTDDIGVAGAGLTNIPWNAAWDAEVQSEVDDALVARNLDKLILAAGTADSGSTTTMIDTARTEGDADYWKGRILLFTSGNIAGQCAIIVDFNQTTDTFTFAPPLTQAVSTQNYVILPGVSVWDDTLAEHLISGSTGAALNAAGSAGDPWNTALPGAYGAGTAGNILGNNLNATVSSRASQTSLDTLDDFVDTEVAAIKAKTDQLTFTTANKVDATIQAANDLAQAAADKVWLSSARTLTAFGFSVTVSTNNDKTGYSLSGAGIQAIWDVLTSGLTTANSIGKLLVDNINATISSRSSHSAADVWSVVTRVLTAGTNIVLAKGVGVTGFNDLDAAGVRGAVGLASANLDTQLDALPTAAENADAVWDETLSGHLGAGSTGAALNAAGSAGDPWGTALPGVYGAGTAGNIVGNNLNASVGSRASQTSLDALDDFVDTEVAAIKAKTDQLTFTASNKVDATIQAAADFAQAAADKVWSTTARTLTAFGFTVTVSTNNDKTGYTLSSAGVQAIWDVLTSALTTVNSIGKLLVDNINATLSSRATQTAVDNIEADTQDIQNRLPATLTAGGNMRSDALAWAGAVTATDDTAIKASLAKGTDITGFNDLTQADIRSAIGLASANLDVQLNALPTAIENADAVWDLADGVEVGLTPRQAMRLLSAALAGRLAGAATTTITIRNAVVDSKPRITATVDNDGNRTAIVTDVT